MKTAKPNAADGPSTSSRRAQPPRQTRTNPPRMSSFNRGASLTDAPGHEQPIGVFPAVTHFADAITALPKELVRHFTLLKEVDAKIYTPEETLFQLIGAALDDPSSSTLVTVAHNESGSSAATPAATGSHGSGSDNGRLMLGYGESHISSVGDASHAAILEPAISRHELLRQSAYKISELLVSLEEKNHVISTANEALHKQLARIEDVWPHLEGEFSEEAKWGSTAHWAYLENRVAKANNTQAERSRREGAATLSAAAQLVAEEAAARSSDRKKAIAERKSTKVQTVEVEADPKQQEQAKKSQGNGKSRKAPAEAAPPVGLGISTPASGSGGNSSSKRRKTENKPSGSAPMERAMSSVFGSSGPKMKTVSPRETPAPDASSKKRKALPTSSNQPKKSRTGTAASPTMASSPVVSGFPDTAKSWRASPAPPSTARPASSRARQNSIQAGPETSRPRPSSTVLTKPPETPDLALQNTALPTTSTNDTKVAKEAPAVASKVEVAQIQSEPEPPPAQPEQPSSTKSETAAKDGDEGEAETALASLASVPVTAPTVTTKSGRASKPSTPAVATFAEAAASRSRPSRNVEGAAPVKRSHKKGASISAAAAAVALAAQQAAAEVHLNRNVPDDEEDGEIDGDEPRYCYCNGVSYGEMVACDADGCPREWFHLECVGLKVAPKGNAKWYCDDCKKRTRPTEKKAAGR